MKVKFLPQNVEVEANSDKSLLQIANENHLEIRSVCKGIPSCAECRVRIIEGENNILPPNKAELGLIGTNYFIDGRRLSCQVHCFGDITVDLTEQVERQDSQVKKIRGFKTSKQVESKAVNDMMLLDESLKNVSETGVNVENPEEAEIKASSEKSPTSHKPQGHAHSGEQNQQRSSQKQNQRPHQHQKQHKGQQQPQQNKNQGQKQPQQKNQNRPQSQAGQKNNGGQQRPPQDQVQAQRNQKNQQQSDRPKK